MTDGIGLHRVRLPLVRSHRWGGGHERTRESVLVSWTVDGVTGWGECPTLTSPGYATETTEQAWQALVGELAPAALRGAHPRVPGVVAAPAALADARLDARLRRSGTTLASYLGADRSSLARTVVLADLHADPAELVARAELAVGSGAALVKLKVAPGHDVDPVHALVAALAGRADVAADANGAYRDPEGVLELDAVGLRYLEQPFPAGVPLRQLAEWHTELRTPVALDESLVDVASVRSALEEGAADVVSVKPARLGGVEAAAEAVRLAAAAGVPAFVGGMLELGIGRAGAAAVAAMEGCTLPTDLGPSDAYVEQDVCEPVMLDDAGELIVPDGPGCGRVPDPARLAAVTVDEVHLQAAD